MARRAPCPLLICAAFWGHQSTDEEDSMTWGEDIAAKLLANPAPADFQSCLAVWEEETPCQLITLERLKEVLGIVDPAEDAELTRLIDLYSAAIAGYTERQLCSAAREAVYIPRNLCAVNELWLPQWPVTAITLVEVNGDALDPSQYQIIGRSGRLLALNGAGFQIRTHALVQYTGGYDPLPADLENAIIQLIKNERAGSGGSDVGPMKSERVEGAVTVTYYDPRSSVASTSSGSAEVGQYSSVLDYYRGERAFL